MNHEASMHVYTLMYDAIVDSPWRVYLPNVDPTLTAVVVTGLTPARTYQFRVCAVNQVGKGQIGRAHV